MPSLRGTPFRRVVTTHRSDKSSILSDEKLNPEWTFLSHAATVWETSKHPAELQNKNVTDGTTTHIYGTGTLIRVVDFPANSQGHNHRTASVDYGIILHGELELVLDDGSRTILRAGDIVVQQATMHQWNNLTDSPARIVFVLIPSEKPIVNGVAVAESGVPEHLIPHH